MSELISSAPPRILTPKERRQRNRDEMSAAILETARQIMREEGVGAFTLHELARRIGMRPSSLYVYFPGKMGIYDAIYRIGVRLYREEIGQAMQMEKGPWETLYEIFERYMRFAKQNPELFQIVMERPIPGFVPSEVSMIENRQMESEMTAIMNRVTPADQGQADGGVSAAHGLIMAMMHGLTALHMANDPNLPVGEGRFGSLIPEAEALFESAWDGMSSYSSSSEEIKV